MTALYNEIEPSAASWLGNLIAAGHIAPGAVDTRSIRDLRPEDVRDDRVAVGAQQAALFIRAAFDAMSSHAPCAEDVDALLEKQAVAR